MTACALLGAVTLSASAQNRKLHPLPLPRIPDILGVNIHFNDPKPGEMEQLAAAGFRWIRQDFAWGGIEREKGTYDFAPYERLLALLKSRQMRPIFILDYGNDLYGPGSPRTPEARAAFARFAAASVTHFKDQGILWEMWNEPNGGFWSPKANVDEYAALAVETGKAIRKAAPNEWYVGPGVSGMDMDFMEKCFKAGMLQYWDAVSFHPYRNTPPETAAPEFDRIREIIARYAPKGKSIPILNSEWGYSELYPGLGMTLQSKYIARQALTNLMNGLVVSIWYDWHDDGLDPKEPEHHFGTVYNDYRPKPTYTSLQTLATELNGFRFDKRLALPSQTDYCLLLTNGKEQQLAVWTTETREHEVVLPASKGRFHVLGYLGDESSAEATSEGLRLTLTDAPQYLRPEKPNALLSLAAQWNKAPARILVSEGPGKNFDSLFSTLAKGSWANGGRPLKGELTLAAIRASTPGDRNNGWKRSEQLDLTWRSVAPLFPAFSMASAAREHEFFGRRDEKPLSIRISLSVPGVGTVSQETEVTAQNPLAIVVQPAVERVLLVRVENPTGKPFTGMIVREETNQAQPLRFKQGEKEKIAKFTLKSTETAEYSVRFVVRDNMLLGSSETYQGTAGKGGAIVLSTPALRLTPFESFAELEAGTPLSPDAFPVLPDGDPKVRSTITATVEEAPAGLPGKGGKAARISYDFDAGWKFLRLAATGEKARTLPGKPYSLGMWVDSDGSGDMLLIRFADSTGQTFQQGAGKLDWKGWRYVSFPLTSANSGYWGGANDGAVHYPIHMDTLVLIDSPGGRGGKGTAYVTGLTLAEQE